MSPKAKREKKSRAGGLNLWEFLRPAKFALLIIALNLYVFYYLQNLPFFKKHFLTFVLSVGNLLHGNVWCLITAGFLHHNQTHLFSNMLGIFVFGRVVERRMGFWKTAFIYSGALFLSMLFSAVMDVACFRQNIGVIGASGALMGLIGAAMLLDPFYISYEMLLPLPVMVKAWLFFYADLEGVLTGVRDGVSHVTHIFGFLSIGVLVYFLSKQDKKMMRTGLIINIISLGGFFLLWYWLNRVS